jgi:hypothetical protein
MRKKNLAMLSWLFEFIRHRDESENRNEDWKISERHSGNREPT